MTTDPAIIAAAHRALRSVAFPRELHRLQAGAVVADVDEACAAILAAVTPLIEAVALERAARIADDRPDSIMKGEAREIATAIRTLKP